MIAIIEVPHRDAPIARTFKNRDELVTFVEHALYFEDSPAFDFLREEQITFDDALDFFDIRNYTYVIIEDKSDLRWARSEYTGKSAAAVQHIAGNFMVDEFPDNPEYMEV
jgi:hypothetical protein